MIGSCPLWYADLSHLWKYKGVPSEIITSQYTCEMLTLYWSALFSPVNISLSLDTPMEIQRGTLWNNYYIAVCLWNADIVPALFSPGKHFRLSSCLNNRDTFVCGYFLLSKYKIMRRDVCTLLYTEVRPHFVHFLQRCEVRQDFVHSLQHCEVKQKFVHSLQHCEVKQEFVHTLHNEVRQDFVHSLHCECTTLWAGQSFVP